MSTVPAWSRGPQRLIRNLQAGQATGWLLALVATLAFSISTPLGKAAVNLGVDPTTLLLLRFALSTGLLAGTVALTAPDRLRIDRRGFAITFVAGVVNGLGALAFFWSLTRLEASVATMIYSLNPLAILGLLALRGEKLTSRHWLRLALGLGGAYLLIGPSGQVDLLGVALVLVNVFSVALELSLVQWFLKDYGTRTVALYVLSGMLVVIFGFWMIQGGQLAPLTAPAWLVILSMALFCTYFAWLALFSGVSRLGSGQYALLIPLETLLSVIWALAFLGERMDGNQALGALLILGSALLAIRRLRLLKRRLRWRTVIKV